MPGNSSTEKSLHEHRGRPRAPSAASGHGRHSRSAPGNQQAGGGSQQRAGQALGAGMRSPGLVLATAGRAAEPGARRGEQRDRGGAEGARHRRSLRAGLTGSGARRRRQPRAGRSRRLRNGGGGGRWERRGGPAGVGPPGSVRRGRPRGRARPGAVVPPQPSLPCGAAPPARRV